MGWSAGVDYVSENGWYRPKPAGGGGFALAFGSIANSSAGTTTVDYGTMAYPAGATRIVVLISSFASSETVSAVTVNGVSATAVVTSTTGSANLPASVWMTNSSVSGSSGDVQVTFGVGNIGSSAVALYGLTTTTTTPSTTQVNGTASGTSISQAITVPAGGGSLVAGAVYGGVGATTMSLTNATVDGQFNNGGTNGACLIVGHTTATGSVTPSVNSTTATVINVALAAWGP